MSHGVPAASTAIRSASRVLLMLLTQSVVTWAQPGLYAGARAAISNVAPLDAKRPKDDRTRPSPERIAPTLVVPSTARGFQVIPVDVPSEFASARSVRYEVFTTGAAPMLSRADGAIDPPASRRVLLTVGVPSRARAGQVTIASVFFTAGSRNIEVPIALDIAAQQRIEISVNESLRGVRPGSRVTVTVQLLNLGNRTDTIGVRADLPAGWRMEGGDARTSLSIGASVARSFILVVPRETAVGTLPIRLHALSLQGTVLASTELHAEVFGTQTGRSIDGATLKVSGVATRGPWDGTIAGAQYNLDGSLTRDVRISATAVSAPGPTTADGRAMSRAGFVATTPMVALYSNSWRASFGPSGQSLTDLTGQNVGGEGLSLMLKQRSWSAQAVALRPTRFSNGFGSTSTMGQLSRRFGAVTLVSTAASLSESVGPTGTGRHLDAMSMGAQFGSGVERTLSSELGYRRFNGGQGLGASTAFSMRGSSGTIELRGAHAAGGSDAFARGTNDFGGAFSRTLTRWLAVSGSGWSTADDGRQTRSLSSRGWQTSAQLSPLNGVSLQLGGRGFGYEAATNAGSFGSDEQAITSALRFQRGGAGFTLDGSYGARARTTGLSTIAVTDRAAIGRVSAIAQLNTPMGTFGISGSIADNGAGQGYVGRVAEYRAEIEQVPLLKLGAVQVTAGASNSRQSSFVTPGAWIDVTRGSLAASLPGRVTLRFDAERNPLYFVGTDDAARSRRWLTVARLERSITLPQIGRGTSTQGIVFHDDNGNGQRDRKETGVVGVILRRGAESVVTDAAGRYRFQGQSADAVSVDARSLPMGWVTDGLADAVRGDVSLIPLASTDVHVRATSADSARISQGELAKIIVTARDSAGRTWIARPLNNGLVRFDALPPGQYELGADFGANIEPLRVHGNAVTFAAGLNSNERMVLEVEARPLRFQSSSKATNANQTKVVGEPAREPQRPAQPRSPSTPRSQQKEKQS